MNQPTLADSLLQFCGKIGIAAEQVRKAETPSHLRLTIEIQVNQLLNLSGADLTQLLAAFGSALTLRLGLPEARPLVEIEHGQAANKLETGLQEIARLDRDFGLQLQLIIEKKYLLPSHLADETAVYCLLYIFKDRLTELLTAPLLSLDKLLFKSRQQPTLILVTEGNIWCSGPLLTICSFGYQPPDCQPVAGRLQARIDRHHAAVANNLNWAGFQFEHITPLHFLAEPQAGADTEIEETLARNALHLTLLYTANRSEFRDNRFKVLFANSEQSATLTLGAEIPQNTLNIVPRLAIWPYSGQENTDRLTIFQNVMARELESDAPEENYHAFIQRLRALLDEVRWHHRLFVNSRVIKHFEQVREATDYINSTAKNVSQTLESVTKGLTDALMASIGFFILTLLAALIERKTQQTIFVISSFAYAAYLILFQVIYRMGSIWHSYLLLNQETDERLEVYTEILGKTRITPLLKPLNHRKQQFLIWFWVTAAIYVLLAIGFMVMAGYLPEYFSSQPTVTPDLTTPGASPIATPTP